MGDDFEPLPPADDDASAGSPAKSKSDRKEKKEKKSRSKSGKSRERTESTDSSKKSSHKSHKSKSRPDLSVDDDADVDHAPAGQAYSDQAERDSLDGNLPSPVRNELERCVVWLTNKRRKFNIFIEQNRAGTVAVSDANN